MSDAMFQFKAFASKFRVKQNGRNLKHCLSYEVLQKLLFID